MSGLELGIKGAELYDNNFSGFKHRIFWIEGWGGKKNLLKISIFTMVNSIIAVML